MKIYFKTFAATIVIVSLIGFVLSVSAAVDIQQRNGFLPCFTAGCINYAIQAFSPSINILKSTLQFAAGLAVCWGVVVSSMTYHDNATRMKESDIKHHYNKFRDILSGHALIQMVDDPIGSEKTIYKAIFTSDGSRVGTLAAEFIRTMSNLHDYVEVNHPQLGSGDSEISQSAYNNSIHCLFGRIGIKFQNSRNSDVEPNSNAVFDFIDKVCLDYPQVPRMSQFKAS